jgi:hypothetical protein
MVSLENPDAVWDLSTVPLSSTLVLMIKQITDDGTLTLIAPGLLTGET